MRVAVLVGGDSAERDVSLATGIAIVAALRSNGHQVLSIDTSEGGERGGILASLPLLEGSEVIFIALHGGDGEDGRLQATLDLVGVSYTGSGYLGSALAMDKLVSKELMVQAGVRTPPWLVAPVGAANIEAGLGGFPVVVKPSREGSTVGVTLVEGVETLDVAIHDAASFGAAVLIEKYVPGRELAVGVLGDRALPVVEIVPSHKIYDYECKYTRGRSEYHVPAPIDDEVTANVQELALAVHRALRLSNYSRVDFRLDADDTPWCLEANSLPGMTETSLLPKAARAAGLSFNQLCERIVQQALK